ncbi:TonB-dependent receptor [Sphingorhabdus sp.]|uniref:TonB-dependent receptor n=1 Tax=Sphingorhabdus sp. TaxID=1902408 RepID=UPI002627C20B|nr:TonB-dependent receptor [Sphingorhabdus sp.]MDH4398589.1 TonB-dependent receptor [Sphingorhabdus sp.]
MKIGNIRTLFMTSTVLAAGLVISGAAQAQSAPAEEETADQGGIAEIIVTARKSSENIQSVPVAVTALSADDLASKQVFEVTDLARTAPSLTISTGGTGPASIVYLAIRGQAQNSPNSLSDSSVGIYMDGVYVARPIVGNLGFLDMASAEVLRGPQGTLFGRNTTGGALNLTSNRPSNEYEGMLKVGFGNYNYQSIEGMVNAPVSDEAGIRIAGRYGKRDGYFRNNKIGYPQGSIDKDLVLRGTLVYAPAESNLKFTLIGDLVRYADDGNATAVAAINPGVLSLPAYGAFINSEFSQFVTAAQQPAFTAANSKWTDTFSRPQTGDAEIDKLQNNNDVDAIAGTIEWDLGGVNIKSITAYRKSFTNDSLDLHGFPSSVNPFTPFLPNATSAFISTYNNKQFSQELQLSGSSGALDWQTGVYYFKESGDEQSRAFVLGGVAAARTLSDYSSRSAGTYAQINYNVSDALRVTGGLRYTWDKRTIDRRSTDTWRKPDNLEVCTVGPNSGKTAEAAPCSDPASASFKYPAWTLGLDYRVNDQLFLYAKTSGASMSGGFNSRFVPAPFTQQFSPEKVRDAEFGFKGDFLDRRLRTNMAFFSAKQSNVQRIVNALVGTSLTQFVTNAGKVNAKGFEFEGTALPWGGMELTGSLSYLDAKYVRGSRNENQGTASAPVFVDRAGEPVTQAPKWTWNIGATQTFETSFGDVSLHADYAYIADRAMDAATAKPLAQGGTQANINAIAIANAASIVKGYGLLNGRIAINFDSPDIELAFWGRNLANQAWFTNVFNSYTGLGATVQYQGAPRTFGATATIKF